MLRLGSVCSYPDRLVDCLKGSAGTGRRRLDAERVQASQKPFEGQPRSPHPNRLVWTWVEVRPVRFCVGPEWFARRFLFECGIR